MTAASADPASPFVGRRVLVPRAAAQAAGLTTALVGEGADVLHLPMLRIEFDGGTELQTEIATLSGYDWIVFTSANAVRACVIAGLTSSRGDASVASIGSATAEALDAAGIEVDFSPSQATAAALSAELPSASTALLPLAELAKTTLEDGLHQRGFTTTRVTAYRSVLPAIDAAALAAAATADIVLATAPSVVDRLVDVLGVDAIPQPLVCIGPSTATAAYRHGLAAVVANPHNDDGLVAAARQTLADLR